MAKAKEQTIVDLGPRARIIYCVHRFISLYLVESNPANKAALRTGRRGCAYTALPSVCSLFLCPVLQRCFVSLICTNDPKHFPRFGSASSAFYREAVYC